MEAKEAQSISRQNEMSLDEMYKQIKSNAEYGNRSMTFLNHISVENITQLIGSGYKISLFTDPIGMSGTKVEW